MLESQTADEIANSIRLYRSHFSGTIIIVEGPTDVLLYQRLINKNDRCLTIVAHSKENAIKALYIVEEESYKGIICIVDSDFWNVDGCCPESEHLFTTDTHDLESMIISSNAIDKVLAEYGDREQIGSLDKSVREILLENALPIGLTRWLSSPHKRNLGIDFKIIDFLELIDRFTFSVDIEILLMQLRRRTLFDKNALMRDIKRLMKSRPDSWQICSGHDLVQILSVGLREIIGNDLGRRVTAERLDSILRIAYEDGHFYETKLFSKLVSWEAKNIPYKIF
jgi:hypothetical protein